MNTRTPVSRSLELSSDVLAGHGRALRGLARSLLGDPQAADDVVQETWVTCLVRPRVVPERLSSWLATVARRLALRRLRGEGRRSAHERSAAVPERIEEAAQRALEREEALRAVTQALLALEEPFKTALLMRYYEDKSPAAIAAELGVPLATVKSRLARGLEKLRMKLATEFLGEPDSRQRGLAALAGLASPGLLASTTTGAAVAGTLGSAALVGASAAVLALALGAFWWRPSSQGNTPAAGITVQERKGAPASAPSPLPESNAALPSPSLKVPDNQREAAAVASGPESKGEPFPSEATYRFRIAGRLRDHRDQPIEGAGVYLAPRLFPLNRAVTTDAEGRFAVAFDGRSPRIDLELGFEKAGFASSLREVGLSAGTELTVDVGLRPSSDVVVEGSRIEMRQQGASEPIVYEIGGSQSEVEEAVPAMVETLQARLALPGAGTTPFGSAPEMLRRADGGSLFVEPPPMRTCLKQPVPELMELLQLVERRALLEEARISLRGSPTAIQELAFSDLYEPIVAVKVSGTVRDSLGRPVPGVQVGYGRPGQCLSHWMESDANGAFALDGMMEGTISLRAGGGDHGLAEHTVSLEGGGEFTWNPVLERGAEVTGRVLGEGGRPLARVLVELWSTDAAWLYGDSARTDAEGRFAIPNVPGGVFELHLCPPEPASCFPVRVVAPVFPGSDLGEIQLANEELTLRSLSLRVVDASGHAIPGTEVRVWQVASGAGVLADTAEGLEGAFRLPNLPGGSFRLEVGSALGWRDLGTVWIDPHAEGELVLGTERFEPSGVVLVERTSTADRAPLTLWSAHAGVFGHVKSIAPGQSSTLALRPGEFVMCARLGDRRSETLVRVESRGASSWLVGVDPAEPLASRSSSLDPALEVERCSACHAPGAPAEGL